MPIFIYRTHINGTAKCSLLSSSRCSVDKKKNRNNKAIEISAPVAVNKDVPAFLAQRKQYNAGPRQK